MALGDSYATSTEVKTRLEITGTSYDTQITDALTAASREVDHWCTRQFNDAGSATARVFYPVNCDWALVDDFSTTTGLVIATDSGDDGTYETTWSATNYQLEPINGIVDGESGWPYWRIRAVGSSWFPTTGLRTPLQVTARWGWAAVPSGVKQATLILAAEMLKLKDAPFGVAGFGEFGAVRVRNNPKAMTLLAPYRRSPVLVG